MSKITKRFVDQLCANGTDKIFWDEDLPGFGVRMKPSGVKSYLIQYRNSTGQSKRLTLARHGRLAPGEARQKAKQLLAAADRGEDPASEAAADRGSPTVNELMDRYIKEHVCVHNKPNTAKEFVRLTEKQIRPRIGRLKVKGVTRADIAKLHTAMASTPRQANHVLSVLSKAFNLAEIWSMRPENSNPVRLIKKFPEVARERLITRDELARIARALDVAAQEGKEQSSAIQAARLLIYSGCRLNEILMLRWEDVSFDDRCLFLPDGKTGKRVVILNVEADAILRSLPRYNGVDWVLPNQSRTNHLDDKAMQKFWRRLRAKAGLDDIRLHDLRHNFGTYAGQSGANAFHVRDLLGHKTLAMTDRYVSRDLNPVRNISDQVGAAINEAMRKGESPP